MKRKIRVGILLESHNVPAWLYYSIKQVIESQYAEVVLAIFNEGSNSATPGVTKPCRQTSSFAYAIFNKAEARISRCKPNALESKKLQALVEGVVSIKVCAKQNQGLTYFAKEDIQRISQCELDVLFAAGMGDLSGDILDVPRYGVWCYQHSDTRVHRGGPPGFWEVMLKRPTAGSTLKILGKHGHDDDVLALSTARTERVLVHWSNNKCYWKALSFLPRRLKDLYELGPEAFFLRVSKANQHPVIYSAGLYQAPGNVALMTHILKHYIGYLIGKMVSMFYFEQWVLLFRIDPAKVYTSELHKLNEIRIPKDRYWADPFTAYANGKYYIFFEEFIHKLGKGHISYIVVDSEGTHSDPTRVLELPYHISYPFLFQHNGEYYMIPETGSNRTIDLYKSLSFPDRWEKVITLMEGVRAVDTTLLQKDGLWWLFVNICENEGAAGDDELFLFYASELVTQDWTPHPLNPIVSDVRTARPAGKIFTHNGNLYRPAQNCSRRYGYGMAINQIVTLSTTDYQENCVNEIRPDWDKSIVATHTINFEDNMMVIDAIKRRIKVFS